MCAVRDRTTLLTSVINANQVELRQSRHEQSRILCPGLLLFLVAPVMAELLSGTQPPIGFFNPLMLAMSLAFYGPGALLIRETALYWKKGWPSILLLGAAYGVIEEGLMIKNFFDPSHATAGNLGVYGRALGINWVFSIGLIVYHAVVSISVPIMIVEAVFPVYRDASWVGPRLRPALALLMAVEFCCTFFVWRPYQPPALQYGLTLLLLGGLIWTARLVPKHFAAAPSRPPSFWTLRLIGFTGVLVFVLYFTGVNQKLDPVVDIALFLGLLSLLLFGLARWASHPVWTPRHQLALATGVVLFYAILALVAGDKPPRNRAGMRLVGLIAILLIFLLNRRVKFEGDVMQTESSPKIDTK